MLDVDVVFQQVVEDGHAGLRLESHAFGTDVRVWEDDDLGHGRQSESASTRRPVSARDTLRSMRRAANSPVAWLSASTAPRSAR